MWLDICRAYPMTFSYGESGSLFHISFEELVGEVLCKEGKHDVGALGVRDKLLSHKKLLSQQLSIR